MTSCGLAADKNDVYLFPVKVNGGTAWEDLRVLSAKVQQPEGVTSFLQRALSRFIMDFIAQLMRQARIDQTVQVSRVKALSRICTTAAQSMVLSMAACGRRV